MCDSDPNDAERAAERTVLDYRSPAGAEDEPPTQAVKVPGPWLLLLSGFALYAIAAFDGAFFGSGGAAPIVIAAGGCSFVGTIWMIRSLLKMTDRSDRAFYAFSIAVCLGADAFFF